MKKLKLISLVMLSTIILGCSLKKPSNIVEEYFTEIKKSEPINIPVDLISNNQDTKVVDMMDEAMSLYLNEIKIKILSENINEKKATVEVELTGLNMANMYVEINKEYLGNSFGNGEISSERLSRGLLEKAMLEEPETRKGTINLTKVNKAWKIKIDSDYNSLVYGTSDIPINKLK